MLSIVTDAGLASCPGFVNALTPPVANVESLAPEDVYLAITNPDPVVRYAEPATTTLPEASTATAVPCE
jgi:hypothetical protein